MQVSQNYIASQIKEAQNHIKSALSPTQIKYFAFSFLSSLRKGGNRYSLAQASVGSGISISSVQRANNHLFNMNLFNWQRRNRKRNTYHFAPFLYWSQIKRWLIRWLSNCINEFGWLKGCKQREAALAQRDLLNKIIYEKTGLKPEVTGTPPPPGLTFGEVVCQQNRGIQPDGSKNRLNQQQLYALLDDAWRPRELEQATEPKSLKREVHERTQSDTGLHSGDYGTVPVQVGSDQAYGVPGSGDSPSTLCNQAQQDGPQPLWSVLQRSIGLLQSKQPASGMEEGRFSERDLQNARECSDVAGYEGDWAEVYD